MTIAPAPAGDPPTVTPPAVDPPALTAEQLQAQLAETTKALKAANRESAERRKRLDDLEAAETARASASMTELEKLKKQLADAQAASEQIKAQAAERLIRAEIIGRAGALNFQDPADAYALIDRAKITIDDAGKVDGADELLAEMAKAKPYMLKTAAGAPPNINAGNRGASTTTATQDELVKRKLAKGGYGSL